MLFLGTRPYRTGFLFGSLHGFFGVSIIGTDVFISRHTKLGMGDVGCTLVRTSLSAGHAALLMAHVKLVA